MNRSVPEGADSDAAALSRPQQTPEQTVPTHDGPTRISLLTGATVSEIETSTRATPESAVSELISIEDARTAHKRWLTSDVASAFNESVYHLYTSLKYHTLLVAALLANYRAGYAFADLRLVVDPVGEIVPFRTIFDGDRFALRIDGEADERPAARLGQRPWRSWASAWPRLPVHPLDTDHDRYDRTLDANLRRIRSWSTALQYIEDYADWRPDR